MAMPSGSKSARAKMSAGGVCGLCEVERRRRKERVEMSGYPFA